MEVIDQVAIVSSIDENRNYKYVNEFFCEVSGYKVDEIVGSEMSIMKPDDVADSLYDQIWDQLQEGHVWSGKLKLKAKDNIDFYVTSTIFPVFEEDDSTIFEYISIEFITTEYEHQKRKFKKEVMYNLQETRRINTVARKKIDELMEQVQTLEAKVKSYRHFDILEDKFKLEKQRTATLKSQIKYHEEQVKDSKERYEKVSTGITEQIYKTQASTNTMKKKVQTAFKEVDFLKAQLTTVQKDNDNLKEMCTKHKKMIEDFQEMNKH